MGFELKQNFNQPYFAKNIKEFWKRWHISLSSWLQDYVYISLGGSRKGKIRTYCNLMITFLVSAVWHGKGIKFLIWGGLHGMYQIAGRITERFRSGLLSKIGVKKENKIVCILQTCITFVMVDFAWLFFSASSTKDALVIIYRILTEFQFSKTMADKYYLLGTREESFVLLFLAVVILFIIDMIHERNISISDWIEKKHIIVRWTIYLMAALIVISGFIYNYGAEVTNFLYAQF